MRIVILSRQESLYSTRVLVGAAKKRGHEVRVLDTLQFDIRVSKRNPELFYQGEGTTYPFGAYLCMVEIDRETGAVQMLRFDGVDDCGPVINPLIVAGQVHGGIAQGLGFALMEEYHAGRTDNLHDYLIPTFGDIPPIETLLIEDPEPAGPFGAKGVGESPNVGSPPAIVNAVIDALHHTHDIDHIDMPCTPARVWAAMQGRAEPPQ